MGEGKIPLGYYSHKPKGKIEGRWIFITRRDISLFHNKGDRYSVGAEKKTLYAGGGVINQGARRTTALM